MDAYSMLMTLRPMSQMLRFYVVPEIERRIAAEVLKPGQLPFRVHQFRYLNGDGQHLIEINDEVKLLAEVKTTRAIAAGEELTMADIHPKEVFLKPPTVNGKPAAFFLCLSEYLNFITMFDFTPNAPPDPSGEAHEQWAMKYPLADMVQAQRLHQAMNAADQYRRLGDASWPPSPAYYPGVLWRAHNEPGFLASPACAEAVAAVCGPAYWRQRLDFWSQTDFFKDRHTYVKKAVDEYLAADYVSSIYVLVPHVEGIVKDYLDAAGITPPDGFKSSVHALKNLVLSRKVLMFPRSVLDEVFKFIETGTFLANTANVTDAGKEVTRHGIAHGVFKNFENRDIALKYLILLDALGYVMLHDKVLAGTL
jgi:hypothetical protein